MTHKGWCVVKHQTNKQTNRQIKFALRYWKSIRFKTGVVDFEGHKFSYKLTRVSFDFWLNRFASLASFMIAHSSLNDSKWIDSSVCSKLHPFKNTDIPNHPDTMV